MGRCPTPSHSPEDDGRNTAACTCGLVDCDDCCGTHSTWRLAPVMADTTTTMPTHSTWWLAP
eukprot:14511804-Heterocapsa_arctica.AAC.1